MAEGWARQLRSSDFEVYSAGIETHGMNEFAIKVMAESGIDISNHYSKLVSELSEISFDLVVTVCDNAKESCPIFSTCTHVIHMPFADPPKLAAKALESEKAKSLSEQEKEELVLDCYRKIRDQIKESILSLKT
jgi:arsenate reductase